MGRRRLHTLATCAALGFGSGLAPVAAAFDWSEVPAREILVFHTGQASYEWMLTEKYHSGGPKIRQGKTCVECHADEEQKIGTLVASGEKLEPEPGSTQVPWSSLAVQFAQLGGRLHVRLQWPVAAGTTHSRIALLFDDDGVNAFRITGCWATCHADLPAMAHDGGLDLTKYLTQSRTKMSRKGGADRYQPAAKLEELAGKGLFLEFWEVDLRAGTPPAVRDGYVLEAMHESDPPLVRAEGSQTNGMWTAVLSRDLVVSEPHRKSFTKGKTYTFGLSVHDVEAEGRFHRVSLEQTLTLDEGEAAFVAREH